jgi:hypothetical protein
VWRYLQGFKGGLAAVADTTKGCTVTFDYMPPFAYNEEIKQVNVELID